MRASLIWREDTVIFCDVFVVAKFSLSKITEALHLVISILSLNFAV